MIRLTSRLKALAAALLGGTALTMALPQSEAQAACVKAFPGAVATFDCTGATTNDFPLFTLPQGFDESTATSGVVNLGSDGNAASITNTTTTAVDITSSSAPGAFVRLDTKNLGAPSTITGATNGVRIQTTTGGADIQIGQNSAGGLGLNANVTGLKGSGIVADATIPPLPPLPPPPTIQSPPIPIAAPLAPLGGNVSITTAPGTTITGTGAPAILVKVDNGTANVVLNGNATGSDGIFALATGAGNINITTAGNITGNNGFGIATTVATGTTTINVGRNSTISGSAGPLSLTGTSIVNNAGALNFVDGAFTTTKLANTTLNGQGGTLAIDVNAGAGRADELMVKSLSGRSTLKLNLIGNGAFISSPIPILVATNVDPGTVISVSGPTSLISYQLQQSAGDPTFALTSTLNTGAAGTVPAGIHAILTSLNTGFFSGNLVQNGSAFIGEPADPVPNQINGGPWVRFAGGQNDVRATILAQDTTAPSKVRTNFNGFQVGVDLGVANVENTGWNTHLGLTGGLVAFTTNDLLLSGVGSSNHVPFMGIYGAVNGHGFFADFQVRKDFYDMQLNNAAVNLAGANLNGNALSANGSAGYHFELPQSWFIEPSGALVYSQLHVNSLLVNIDPTMFGEMDFNPVNSLLGRLGLRAGTTYVCEPLQLALQPFGSASVWHEFEGNTQTNFVSGGVSVPLGVTPIGTFGQLGLGMSAQVLKTGFLGFVRADWRFGENVSGYDVVGGLRYQF